MISIIIIIIIIVRVLTWKERRRENLTGTVRPKLYIPYSLFVVCLSPASCGALLCSVLMSAMDASLLCVLAAMRDGDCIRVCFACVVIIYASYISRPLPHERREEEAFG